MDKIHGTTNPSFVEENQNSVGKNDDLQECKRKKYGALNYNHRTNLPGKENSNHSNETTVSEQTTDDHPGITVTVIDGMPQDSGYSWVVSIGK